MNLPGPSSLGRISACITSETLPHVASSSPASKRGTVIHKFLADCVNAGRDAALIAAEPEFHEVLEAIPVDLLPALDSKAHAAELSLAYNIMTGQAREIGRGMSRDEARAQAKENEMVGSMDLAGLNPQAFVLYDWKTGRSHIDKAEINWQVRTYALMGARAYGLDAAEGAIVRLLDDGEVWHDRLEMDALDLANHESELKKLMMAWGMVQVAPKDTLPPLHEGPHCRFCPALPHCPAKMALLKTAFDGDLSEYTAELTPERAAKAWAKLETASELVERLKYIVKDYARRSPFPTSEGYLVGEVTEHRETIVPARAREALEKAYGQVGGAVYSESVEVKEVLTKAALKSSLRKLVLPNMPGGKISYLEKEALEALRKNGAVSVSSFKAVKEHRVKEETASE